MRWTQVSFVSFVSFVSLVALVALVAFACLFSLGACLGRPVTRGEPTTKVAFDHAFTGYAVDKIDLLLAIDNSGSMADKQDILAKAVPDLVDRLLRPACVGDDRIPAPGVRADPTANDGEECPAGLQPAFRPIADIHVGVLTSSLGGLGSEGCRGTSVDRGLLINRTREHPEVPVAPNASFNVLKWYPPTKKNLDKGPPPKDAYGDQRLFVSHIAELVRGANQTGCGLEAQLESVYQFLIQPDPFEEIVIEGRKAQWRGVHKAILEQRRAFLRPDSLVVVVMLTDEDDSVADPKSFLGEGWTFMSQEGAPRGTSACARLGSSPAARDPRCKSADLACCTSCRFQGAENDPTCQTNGGRYTALEDPLNVRFVRMREKYGFDPQFPVSRYIDGFLQKKVPHRHTEHDAGGRYVGDDQANKVCTNPLFANALPDGSDLRDETLCHLPISRYRDERLVFFAMVGGLPNDLLRTDASYTETGQLGGDTWTKLLGDPEAYRFDRQDPRMVQSTSPREGRPAPTAPDADPHESNAATENLNTSHRDWDTTSPETGARDDLQYACTFPLASPRDCTKSGEPCDCVAGRAPPLCGDNDVTRARTQTRGKAYPTLRPLRVAKELGDQGIVASVCPILLAESAEESPLYGYRPAMDTVLHRLEKTLHPCVCLPQPLTPDPESGEVGCIALEALSEPDATCNFPGRTSPGAAVEGRVHAIQREDTASGVLAEADARNMVCQVKQLVVAQGEDCLDHTEAGWCYVRASGDKRHAGRCEQALCFSGRYPPRRGSRIHLACMQEQNGVDGSH